MFVAHRLDQSRQEYERRIYGKTASLFAGAAEMGAIIGNAPEGMVNALRQYGADLGMAFQIVDDVLDLREGEDRLGKPAGHDLTQGTVTLPTMLYASGLSPASAMLARLQNVVQGDDEDSASLQELVRDVRASGALDEAMQEAERYADRAKTHAAAVPDAETREMLFEVADIVCERSM
jgi:geranylgeranyl pyrophosphate synthase